MKKELAKKVAEHMHKVNEEVNIKRMVKVLTDNMTEKELEAVLRNYEK